MIFESLIVKTKPVCVLNESDTKTELPDINARKSNRVWANSDFDFILNDTFLLYSYQPSEYIICK